MKLTVLCSPAIYDKVELVKEHSVYCQNDMVYVLPDGVTLDTYDKELRELKKRYLYLERGRKWILKNLTGGKE